MFGNFFISLVFAVRFLLFDALVLAFSGDVFRCLALQGFGPFRSILFLFKKKCVFLSKSKSVSVCWSFCLVVLRSFTYKDDLAFLLSSETKTMSHWRLWFSRFFFQGVFV